MSEEQKVHIVVTGTFYIRKLSFLIPFRYSAVRVGGHKGRLL